MSFPRILVSIWVCVSFGAIAQVAPVTTSVWTDAIERAYFYGAVPLVLSALALIGLMVRRYLQRTMQSQPVIAVVYGARPLAWSVFVLILGICVTAYQVRQTQSKVQSGAVLQFQKEIERIEFDIQAQLEMLLGPLRGIRGLVVASDVVSRSEFRQWVDAQELERELSSVLGLGLIDHLQRADVPAFVTTQRRGGAPDYALRSDGSAADLFVIKYAEPESQNFGALGYDVGSEPMRREAAERAMRQGKPALTGRISLVQDVAKRPALLYYLPIYANGKVPATEAARVAAFRGLAYAPIVAASLMEHAVESTQGRVDFKLFDGIEAIPQALLYDSDYPMGLGHVSPTMGETPARSMFVIQRPIQLGGRVFLLSARSTAVFEKSVELQDAADLALIASLLSIFIAFVVWLLLAGRVRAETLARFISSDLAQEKVRSENILSGTNVGTWEWNDQTKEFKVNARFFAMLGFDMDEVQPDVWTFWRSRISPHEWVRAKKAHKLIAMGESDLYSCDMRVQRKDGDYMWVSSRGRVMSRTQDGKIEWVGGIHTDITEIKRNEDSLRDAEEFLGRVGRVAGIGAWQIAMKTKETIWNDQTCEIHGVEHGFKPTMEQALAFYPTEARAQLQAAIARAIEDGLGWDLTIPFNNGRGQSRWVRSVCEVELDDSGVVRLLGAIQDVTYDKQAQLVLAQATATLQSVLDSAVDVAVIATDLHQTITVFNKGAELLLGYTSDELVGRYTIDRFFESGQLAAVSESLALVLGREPNAQELFETVMMQSQQSEWTFVRKDGGRVMVSLVIAPMRDAAGESIGYLGIAQDISRQKEYEQSLHQARQAAEQSNVAKSQFLANMSHEIRTPMNAILGMLKLMHNTPLSEQQRDYTSKTEGAALSLLGLLNDILDFSKVEAGKLQMDPEPFLVDQLLADLSVILSANLGVKNVDLLFDVDPNIPACLLGDAMRIKQILINLGGNAVKFTAQGHVLIEWRLLRLSEGRAQFEVAVRDTGIGIAPENQMRIFEGFSQAEASTTRRYGGTGLGLVISERLIHLMGGKLVLTSALGQGSTFSFTLDLPVAQMPGADHALPALPLHTQPALQAMLVDDNPVARATSAAMMHSLGWQVTQVDSGERALELVGLQLQGQHPPFQAIFVDWQMPGMDGWQTLRDVRRLYHDRTAPILVMLSAQGREHLAQRTQREQELLDGFLVKPLTTAMFRNAIAHAQGATGVIAIPRTSGNAASLRALRLNGMRILVVEDNLINQQVAQELLANEGAHITLADNGRIGVDAVAAASPPFDVVLMDLQMPVMDGLTAARAIRQELGLATLPVIAMTANAMASDREACLAAGMNDHVGKPFDLNHLVGVLMHHTHWQQALDVLATAPAPVVLPTIQWPQGIDGEGALDRMGGNTGLLVKTLRSFARDAVHLPDKVDALLASGDIPTTRRELHGFKGLSATLGVNELSALAAQAEKLTHAGLSSPEDRVQLEMLLTQIRSGIVMTMPVLESLAVQLTGQAELASSTSATSSTDGVDLTKQLHELLVLLRNSDMGAMELHALMRNSCSEDLAPILEPLDAAMAELDFHLAATECEKLIQHMTQ